MADATSGVRLFIEIHPKHRLFQFNHPNISRTKFGFCFLRLFLTCGLKEKGCALFMLSTVCFDLNKTKTLSFFGWNGSCENDGPDTTRLCAGILPKTLNAISHSCCNVSNSQAADTHFITQNNLNLILTFFCLGGLCAYFCNKAQSGGAIYSHSVRKQQKRNYWIKQGYWSMLLVVSFS